MNPHRWFRLGLLSCVVLVCSRDAAAVEHLTVGDATHPWSQYGTTPGGVIDFVGRLDTLRDQEGESVFAGVPDTLRDWIMPLRLRPDLNISLGTLDRGGSIDVPNIDPAQKRANELMGMLDGNHQTAFDRKLAEGRVVINNGLRIRIDLGARFGVNQIVFYPRSSMTYPFGKDYLRAYELYVNDGLPENLYASGQPIFTSPVVRVEDNSDSVVSVSIEPQYVRYMELRSLTTVGFEIDEIEVYGTGSVPVASYVSQVLDLGQPVVWGRAHWIEWLAGAPEDSRLQVQVRSGQDLTPDLYYRVVQKGGGDSELVPTSTSGDTLTQAMYEALRDNERGPIEVDLAHWSAWQPVDNDQDLPLPAPRRYVQFRVDFRNQTVAASRALEALTLEYAPPPVDRIVAEISPPRAEAGRVSTFTYAARIRNTSRLPGVKRFEVETPAQVDAVEHAELLDADDNLVSQADFAPLDGATFPLRSGDFAIEEVANDHFTLAVPHMAEDGMLLRIVFRAAVYRYGTRFEGRAFADVSATLPLLTEGGDADPAMEADGLQVRIPVRSRFAGPVEARPRTLTPNGDGINDATTISYTVYNLLQPSPVRLEIHTLSGRLVRRLDAVPVVSGRYEREWDGRDDTGGLVPPGVYVVHVAVTADGGTERGACSVAVAY